MRLRVVSDGTGAGTHVLVGPDGAEQRLERVTRIAWSVEASGLATAFITVAEVPVDVAATDIEIEQREGRR